MTPINKESVLSSNEPRVVADDTEGTEASGCPRGCPAGDCYCPDGSEPFSCGHGPGGCSGCGRCIDCDACTCGEDW